MFEMSVLERLSLSSEQWLVFELFAVVSVGSVVGVRAVRA